MSEFIEKLETCIKSEYLKKFNKQIDDRDIDYVLSAILEFRFAKELAETNPELVVQKLFEIGLYNKNIGKVCYPCDIVELRNILSSMRICSSDFIPVFTQSFANRVLSQYPIFLLLNVSKLPKIFMDFNGLRIFKSCVLDIKEALDDVLVKEPLDTYHKDLINSILLDNQSTFNVNYVNAVPGYSAENPKLAKTAALNTEITLNDTERKIISLINQFVEYLKRDTGRQIVPRIAGGWVRDHLLGLESDDIDIALNEVTGAQFTELLENYIKQQPDLQGVVGRKYIVDKNIEKSKHLETAGLDLFGQKVEFVNLRNEVYNETSRIPEMVMTNDPKEDAQRRDLTINAMFYNTLSGQVEDYVNGMVDLSTMTLKTPLDPVKTFMDDPIRILRALRFFSRYPNSKLDPSILEAMKNPDVHAMYKKLSPERSAKELRLLMAGEKPVDAIRYLNQAGLTNLVFPTPDNWNTFDLNQENKHHELSLSEHTFQVMQNLQNIAKNINLPKDERGLLLLSSLIHDFGKRDPSIRSEKIDKKTNQPTGQYSYIGHDKSSAKFAKEFMTRMGFEPYERKYVETVVAEHMRPHNPFSSPKKMGEWLYRLHKSYDQIKPEIVFEHSKADALGKSDKLSDEERSSIENDYTTRMKELSDYQQSKGNLIYKPVIDGNKVREIMSIVAPDVAAKEGMITLGKYPKPVHFIMYLTNKLMEAQWNGQVTTPEQGEIFVKKEAYNFAGLWRNQQKSLTPKNLPPKKAQTAFPDSPMTTEVLRNVDKPEVMNVHDLKASNFKFKLKQRVKWRVRGLAFEQRYGTVIELSPTRLTIEWDKDKHGKMHHTSFPLHDLAIIYQYIEAA